MPTRRDTLLAATVAVAGCSTSDGDGSAEDGGTQSGTTARGTTSDRTTTNGTGPDGTTSGGATGSASLTLTTPAFERDGTIPARYTCSGADVSPRLAIEGPPTAAETFALVVDDPDAPGGTFVHWLLWNVPADTTKIPADVPQTETVGTLGEARQGTNGFDELGYRGPCPPEGDDPHTYRFTLHALGRSLDLDAGAHRDALETAIEGVSVVRMRFTAEYGR